MENSVTENIEEMPEAVNTSSESESEIFRQHFDEEIGSVKNEVAMLRDLFLRRLNDDKQKNELIKILGDGANFAFIEPFLADILLVLDRLENKNDEFALSVWDELYDILSRRGVSQIKVSREFNPSQNKAVKVVKSSETTESFVSGLIRNGYTFNGKVIRPAEVVVTVPDDTPHDEE